MSGRDEATRLLAEAAEAMREGNDGALVDAARALLEAAGLLWSLSGSRYTHVEVVEALNCVRAAAATTRLAALASRSE